MLWSGCSLSRTAGQGPTGVGGGVTLLMVNVQYEISNKHLFCLMCRNQLIHRKEVVVVAIVHLQRQQT